RFFGGEAKIAIERDDEAETDGGTVDRCDDRLWDGEKPDVLLSKIGADVAVDLHVQKKFAARRAFLRNFREQAHVGAGAEAFAGSGQDDDADLIVGGRRSDRGGNFFFHFLRPGVELVWAIQRDRRDLICYVVEDLFVGMHGSLVISQRRMACNLY